MQNKIEHKQKVNNQIYNQYGERWYTAFDDPVALLRAESRAKTPWVLDKIMQHFAISPSLDSSITVLDVGCGAGFLSNALAEQGLQVTGTDISEESLNVASRYDRTKKVKYIAANAYQLPFADASFSVVTAMDFLEHVEDPKLVIQECARVLKPGGIFIFHTFNRNLLSGIVVIGLVELLVKNTPKNMHVLRLFIKPSELTHYCDAAGLMVTEMTGIKPVFSSIPFKNYFSGIVPAGLRFELTRSLLLSYMGSATKQRPI